MLLEKRGRNTICCTTHELNALNSRLRDAAADCMMLTEKVSCISTAHFHWPWPSTPEQLPALVRA